MEYNNIDINAPLSRYFHSLEEKILILTNELNVAKNELTATKNELTATKNELNDIKTKFLKLKNFLPIKIIIGVRRILLNSKNVK